MTAVGGPANGLTSIDIGVIEDGSGAATDSLQLKGTGTTYQDFTWAADAAASFGACNAGQTFVGGVDNPPVVLSSSPSNGATNIAVTSNRSVTFSEDVAVQSSWYTLTCSSSGSVTGFTTDGPRTFTINPSADLVPDESCTLTMLAAAVTDLDGTARVRSRQWRGLLPRRFD